MATTISTLNVKLVASAASFASTMSGAARHVTSLGRSVTAVGSKVLAFGGALTALAAGGSIAYLTKQSMDAIDANAKLADRLGMTTESLVGLQHAGNLAGVSAEQLTGGFEKMLNSVGEAAIGTGEARGAFDQLGLSAESLANMSPDEAFKTIAQGLSNVQNAAERARIAQDIFGRSGQGLLPLMMSGAEGIAAAQAEAERLGLTYSRVDAAKVEQANDAISRTKAVFEGVANQIAIGLAPFIEAAATKFTELATAGGGIGPKVGGAIEWIATAIATASDYLNLLPAGFYGFRAAALEAIAAVVGAMDSMGRAIVDVLNMIPGVEIAASGQLSDLAAGLHQVAAEEAAKFDEAMGRFSRGDNAAAVARVFDDIRAKSQTAAEATAANAEKMKGAFADLEDDSAKDLKKVADSLAELEKQARQIGLSDQAKRLDDLKAQGATTEQLTQARALLDLQQQISSLDKVDTGDPLTDFAAKAEKLQQLYAAGRITAEQFAALRDTAKQSLNDKLADSAKQITEDVKTPLEAYEEQIDRLNELLERGLISAETFNRAKLKAQTTLESARGQDGQQASSAVRAGSAEAQRLAFDNARGVQRLTADQYAKKQLEEQKDSNRHLEQIARNTKGGTVTLDLQEADL